MPINDFSRHPLTWQPDPALIKRPRYLSLASLLSHDISNGVLKPGTCLPPQRELADWLDLNFTTVTRAYDICKERSLIYGVTGRGTFVSPMPGKQEEDNSDILDLGAVQGFPEIAADLLVETAQDILKRDYTRELFSYNAREGVHRHKTAGAFWADTIGINISPEQIIVFSGAQNALVSIMLAFFDIGDTLFVDSFTYGNLIEAAHLAHIRLHPIDGDSDGMIPESLNKAASRYNGKGVFLMPTCANPTTITMSKKRKDELALVIARHNLFVIEDDAALFKNSSGTFFERLPNQTFHLIGATRFLAAGLRVAFALCPEKHLEKLVNAHHHLTIKASALDTEIMSELILSGRAGKIIDKKIKKAKVMNGIFEKLFPLEKRRESDTPFFRKLKLPFSRRNGPDIERELISLGVRACHSYRFAALKNPPESFLRLSLSSVATKHELKRALSIIKKWGQGYGHNKAAK